MPNLEKVVIARLRPLDPAGAARPRPPRRCSPTSAGSTPSVADAGDRPLRALRSGSVPQWSAACIWTPAGDERTSELTVSASRARADLGGAAPAGGPGRSQRAPDARSCARRSSGGSPGPAPGRARPGARSPSAGCGPCRSPSSCFVVARGHAARALGPRRASRADTVVHRGLAQAPDGGPRGRSTRSGCGASRSRSLAGSSAAATGSAASGRSRSRCGCSHRDEPRARAAVRAGGTDGGSSPGTSSLMLPRRRPRRADARPARALRRGDRCRARRPAVARARGVSQSTVARSSPASPCSARLREERSRRPRGTARRDAGSPSPT